MCKKPFQVAPNTLQTCNQTEVKKKKHAVSCIYLFIYLFIYRVGLSLNTEHFRPC